MIVTERKCVRERVIEGQAEREEGEKREISCEWEENRWG